MANENSVRTVLVIEDDYFIRETLKEVLECEGYRVWTAQNGRVGLEKLRHSPMPSLILLDMLMPVMGGREFLDELLKDDVLAPIPVVIVSANADISNAMGATAFIKKPVDLDMLLDIVQQYSLAF